MSGGSVSNFAAAESSVLKSLTLDNVGPAPKMSLNFGSRLNILTGDNGLGKSFLLDIIWWSLTRTWPANVNAGLTAGKMALSHENKQGKITFKLTGKTKKELVYTSTFDRYAQAWTGKAGRPVIPGLVIYAMSDGSLAAWDPARNYWRTKGNVDVQERPPAYVLSPQEVWDGLYNKEGVPVCNGLIRDWALWQQDSTRPHFKNLKILLESLSSSEAEIMVPGELTRISLDDARDIPTLRMPYNQDVPILHASSGMRRIVALSYFLLWVWHEHIQAARLLRDKPSNQVIFLIDEIESHLHPSWQRRIVPSVLEVMKAMHTEEAHIQLITATHSPLIMSSLEPEFNQKTDAWFDLNLDGKEVVLEKCEFENQGESNNWLCSNAFDMSSTRAEPYEQLVEKASQLLRQAKITKRDVLEMNQKLVQALNPCDPYLITWRYLCQKEGWLE